MCLYCISNKLLLLIWKFANIPLWAEKLFMTKRHMLEGIELTFISLSDKGDLIQL